MAINLADYSRTAAQRGWGPGWPSCAGCANNLATVTFQRSGVRVTVHKRAARLVLLLGNETERRGYLAKKGQTGAYNCRAIGGTNSPSNHSWGLALDWNWQDNPYTTNPALNRIPPWMPPLWNRYGFAWGGHYSGAKKDYMHFEQMGTPLEVDAMTALAERELLGQGDDDLTPEQAKMLQDLHALFFTRTKPWGGGISNISVDRPEDMDRAEPYFPAQFWMRDNVNVNQVGRAVSRVINDLDALRREVDDLKRQNG